ncbi:MAG: hypothetical protein COB15_07450 [Flavobacteriales bacterium]|nr:MAG: hypothetical protein COB15_07450 [Flavobacteriales bacterium]
MTTKEIRKTHVANLIKIAKADRELTHEEILFVKTIAIKLDITSAEFNEITLNLEAVKTELPTTQEGKLRQLYDILTIMAIDADAHPEEEEMCKSIGKLIGFSDEQVMKAMKLTKENLDKVITPEQIEQIIA